MTENRVQNLHFDVKASSKTPTETLVETPGSEFLVKEHKGLNNPENRVNPEQYFLGSLAGCICRMAHVVAYEKGIELKKLRLNIGGNIDPSKFRGENNEERSGFKELNIKIDAETEVSEESMKEWLEEVENRSQIIDSLENSVELNLQLS